MAEYSLESVSADPESWVDDYGAPLLRYAMSQVRDQNVAEDLVQETFLSALRQHKSFAGRSSFFTWLASIMRHKVADYRRSLRQGKSLGSVSHADGLGELFDERNRWHKTVQKWPPNPTEELEKEEFWEVFEKCVEQLPPLLAEAFRLREIMSRDVADVCEVVGISNGNLAIRLHRACLALRTCLQHRWFKS